MRPTPSDSLPTAGVSQWSLVRPVFRIVQGGVGRASRWVIQMQPSNTADSTINLANPVFLGILAVLAITVLLAVGRWMWLLVRGMIHRRLTRTQLVELFALSIPLAALAVTITYMVRVFAEAASWSR